MSEPSPSPSRPDFERIEAWCRDSRRWRVASAFVPLVVGLATIAMAVPGGDVLEARVQLVFGAALCVAAMLPAAQALERSRWLRVLAELRQRWDRLAREDDRGDGRRELEARLRRVLSDWMGVQ